MERHIGVCYIESEKESKDIGELIIDGNCIEFYSRFNYLPSKIAFIGQDGNSNYKIFAEGYLKGEKNGLLTNTLSHRVRYVLMNDFSCSDETNISGITGFSFFIPELIDWIGIETVSYRMTKEKKIAAVEKNTPSILIKNSNPKIEIRFKSYTLENNFFKEENEKIISQKPKIYVSYKKPVDVETVTSEIECLMQFFGLLIGKVSVAEDIILTAKDKNSNSLLYINHDFSYNLSTQEIIDVPRTYFYILEDNLESYYSNWESFFQDDDFSLLRRIYFSVNNKREKFQEEVFVEYMRFLDGYHTRISGDAKTERDLKEALKDTKKVIKCKIFNDDNRPLFENAIKQVIPEWNYNSNNIGDIAEWIASGYLAKTSLSHRLKELDEKHLSIISHNASNIEKLQPDYKEKIKNVIKNQKNLREEQTDELYDELSEDKITAILIELYYKELGDTRNYYSHYKNNKTGVLKFSQLSESIKVLKATIISIFLYHIGLEDMTRKIIAFDSELYSQTQFLIQENEKPFLSAKEYYENK